MGNKEENNSFLKYTKLSPTPLYHMYICRQDGAQNREFAATHSPTKSEDNKCIAIYLSLSLQLQYN